MNIKRNNSGFTLLEIIIVIIIVGVLASLALPRLFATIEYSRSTEALSAITSIRSSMERCYLQNGGTYAGCGDGATGFDELDVEDPNNSPNAHFTYTIGVNGSDGYTITAIRDGTVDGGTTGHIVRVGQGAGVITRSGNGAFSGLK